MQNNILGLRSIMRGSTFHPSLFKITLIKTFPSFFAIISLLDIFFFKSSINSNSNYYFDVVNYFDYYLITSFRKQVHLLLLGLPPVLTQ